MKKIIKYKCFPLLVELVNSEWQNVIFVLVHTWRRKKSVNLFKVIKLKQLHEKENFNQLSIEGVRNWEADEWEWSVRKRSHKAVLLSDFELLRIEMY